MAFLHEHIILPLSDLATGQRVYHWLQFLKQSAHWDGPQIRQFQDERFRLLVRHVAETVPYYRDLFNQKRWSADDFNNIDNITRLPFVSKSIMRYEGPERFVTENISSCKHFVCHSSGTTGEPFEFYVSKEAYSLNTAAKLHTWYQAGYRLGDCYMKIVSSPRTSFVKKLQDRVNNCICIGFNSLDSSTLQNILKAIDYYHPSVIRTHPNVAFYLALERRKGNYHHPPRVIMTTSSNMTPTYREAIGQSFNCDIIDSYSCEGTANCAETPLHDGYHVTREYGIIEILDNNNQPVSNGIGRVVSTDLWNYAFPFLRYDTLDMVEVKDNVITRIYGRGNEMLSSMDGKIFTSQVICDYFSYLIHGVQAYRLIVHRDDSLDIQLVVNSDFGKEQQTAVADYWTQQTQRQVTVHLVDRIPTTRNGKETVIFYE